MEETILKAALGAINNAIVKELTERYDNPLSKIIKVVIDNHKSEIFEVVDKQVSTLINSKDFKEELKKALNSKVAKVIVGRLGGELETTINQMKQNPATRAKITLAVDNVIAEIAKGE